MNTVYRVLKSSIIFCSLVLFACPAFGQWSYEQIDPDCMITSMWAFSETDMYVGGGYIMDACLYHYDGTGWQSVNNPDFSGPIFEIWGSGGDDVYVAGLSGRHHYDGVQWTEISYDIDVGIWGFAGAFVKCCVRAKQHSSPLHQRTRHRQSPLPACRLL